MARQNTVDAQSRPRAVLRRTPRARNLPQVVVESLKLQVPGFVVLGAENGRRMHGRDHVGSEI